MLVIPLLFLLILCAMLLVFAGLDLLVFQAGLPPGTPAARLLLRLPAGLLGALPAAVFTSLAVLSFRRREGPGQRFLSFIIMLACALAAMGPGFRVLQRLVPAAEVPPPVPVGGLQPGRIQALGDTFLYLEALREGRPVGLVLQTGFPDGELRIPQRAALRVQDGQTALLLPDGTMAARGVGAGAREVLLRHSPPVEAFLAEIRLLNGELERSCRGGTSGFLLLGGALVFFVCAALFLLERVRWPLLRVLTALLLVRGIFFLHARLQAGIAGELGKLLPGSAWAANLTVSFLLLAGVLCLLLGLLARPARREASFG